MTQQTVKPERPGGFLDYLPPEYLAREKILRTIETVFRGHGYDPVETPRIEFLKTLAGETSDTGKNIFHIKSSEDDQPLAMPFDHTVPFARLIAANPFDMKAKTGIRLPWRRMVVGPVFRADSPQSGRYRQFYQFDMDIAGTTSMLADAEITAMMVRTMRALGVNRFMIHLNNRKILNGLAVAAGVTARGQVSADDITKEMMRIMDRQDKIGLDGVLADLQAPPKNDFDASPALSSGAVDKIRSFLGLEGGHKERLAGCRKLFQGVDSAEEGISELEQIMTFLEAMDDIDPNVLTIDFSIARGLDYYTGPVMETRLLDAPEFGSVISGGRYNNLVARFTGKDLPATGTSIGVDRLFAALSHLGAVDTSQKTASTVMVMRISKDHDTDYVKIADEIRRAGINTELSLVEDTTFKSQFNFAVGRGVKFVVICGDDEFERGTVQIKNLETRKQEEISRSELNAYFADISGKQQ